MEERIKKWAEEAKKEKTLVKEVVSAEKVRSRYIPGVERQREKENIARRVKRDEARVDRIIKRGQRFRQKMLNYSGNKNREKIIVPPHRGKRPSQIMAEQELKDKAIIEQKAQEKQFRIERCMPAVPKVKDLLRKEKEDQNNPNAGDNFLEEAPNNQQAQPQASKKKKEIATFDILGGLDEPINSERDILEREKQRNAYEAKYNAKNNPSKSKPKSHRQTKEEEARTKNKFDERRGFRSGIPPSKLFTTPDQIYNATAGMNVIPAKPDNTKLSIKHRDVRVSIYDYTMEEIRRRDFRRIIDKGQKRTGIDDIDDY